MATMRRGISGRVHLPDKMKTIDAATKRLAFAIDALEAALARRQQADGADVTTQLHTLRADRSRLAEELDGQTARSRRLETANREIARRLDTAMDTLRSVIDSRG